MTGTRTALSAPQLTGVCAFAGVALCALAILGLLALGLPDDMAAALTAMSGRTSHVEAMADRADDAFAFPKGAVCAAAADAAARDLQGRLTAAAGRQNLLAVTAKATRSAAAGRLQPLDFALDANGSYPAALAMLRGLTSQRPLLLLDRVDLESKGGYLHLHVSGRVYCWSHARL